MDALRAAEKAMNEEADRCMYIVFACTMIALKRYHGYGKMRIARTIDQIGLIYDECGQTNEKSMIQMLEEETGIEIQNGQGKSWRDLPYLNDRKWDRKPLPRAQMIYMRQQQKKWILPSMLANILLVMYRLYGWSATRDERLLAEINQIREEFGQDHKKMKKAAAEETGIEFDITPDGYIFIHPYRDICQGCDWTLEKCRACEKKKEYERELREKYER
jgi:hypothetical protein